MWPLSVLFLLIIQEPGSSLLKSSDTGRRTGSKTRVTGSLKTCSVPHIRLPESCSGCAKDQTTIQCRKRSNGDRGKCSDGTRSHPVGCRIVDPIKETMFEPSLEGCLQAEKREYFRQREPLVQNYGDSEEQGYFSKCQNGVVRGPATGTLTTNCSYAPGWESYNKWWCRGENWISCKILVKTTRSEKLVKNGRASIQDNTSQHTFTMTLEDLRYSDAGTYWCGIERTGTDLGFKFSVIIDPEPDPTDSPKPVPSTTPASWDSSPPFTQGTNSSQPVTPINPIRSGKMVSSVAAKKPPVWTLLLPLFLVTLEGLCQS